MQLTGAPFLAAVLALTVVGFVAGAAWLPRTRRSARGFIARLLTQVGVSALSLLLGAMVLNNTNGWYANWGDLLGSGSPSVQQDQGGTDAAKALQARPSGPGLPAAALDASQQMRQLLTSMAVRVCSSGRRPGLHTLSIGH